MPKKLYYSAGIYTALGLLGGLFYREFTHAREFVGATQLAVVHTHLLALGTIFMLMLLALEKLFDLGEQKSFRVFFWLYNIGLIITVGMQTTLGIMTVLDHGVKPEIPMLSGISGLGHMLLTAALIALFTALGKRIKLEPHLPSSRPATAAHLRPR